MKRARILLGLAFMPACLALAADPLKVAVVVAPRPHYAGQGIEVRVEVDAKSGPASVAPPRVKDAEVYALPPDPARPSSFRFAVVPGRAGAIDLPPFRARSGGLTGASRTTRLSVASVPPEGRTSAFLGGVGPFELRAEAEPTSLRQGETLDLRVEIAGWAAFGSVRAPDLGEWNSASMKIEETGGEMKVIGTPTRTFRYKVRALKAGRLTLPPIPVSAFDPATRRFATRATSSLTIRVAEPPRFDPGHMDYPAAPAGLEKTRLDARVLAISALGAVAVAGLAGWFVARRRRPRPVDPRAVAHELSDGLKAGGDEVETARAVAEALTTFLGRVGGRSPGVLTPPEARAWFERLTGDSGTANRAEILLAQCDRARFGLRRGEAEGLIAEGGRLLGDVAEAMGREGGKGRGPGEAVETTA